MQNIDWETVYSIVLYIIKNYPFKIIFYTSITLTLGIILCIIFTLVLRKYKAISREQKYYNWLVKLYVPAVFIINIIFSLKIGVFWGSYEALKKDSFTISEQVYKTSSYYVFKDAQTKTNFFTEIQSVISDLSKGNKELKINIVDIAKAYDTKYKVIDTPKNWLASTFAEKYGDRIHTLGLYTMLNATPHANISESISYKEFDLLIRELTKLDSNDVEKSIIQKIQSLFLNILKSQFKSIIQGVLIIWGILMLIPWIEFWIYKYIMKRKTLNTKNKHL